MKSIQTKVIAATRHLSDLLGDDPRGVASVEILTILAQGLRAKLPVTDDKVQAAQDYIREVAEPGSYLESIADLIEELYAELHAKKAAKADKGPDKPSENQIRQGQAMAGRARLWAKSGYPRA
jgi:hypothetical protein